MYTTCFEMYMSGTFLVKRIICTCRVNYGNHEVIEVFTYMYNVSPTLSSFLQASGKSSVRMFLKVALSMM